VIFTIYASGRRKKNISVHSIFKENLNSTVNENRTIMQRSGPPDYYI
jgi:hypothetical protein